MDPGLVGVGSGFVAAVGIGVCPFGGEGAVEAFDFPLGLGPVGPGEAVADIGAEGGGEGAGAVAGPVVGEDGGDGDAGLSEECVGAAPECGRGFLFLVAEDL